MSDSGSFLDRLIFRASYNRWLSGLARRFQRRDEFDWTDYTRHYVGDAGAAPTVTAVLSEVDFRVEGDRIVLPEGALPLHPNHRLIYDTALALRPSSCFEFGLGGGYHLANLRRLFPEAKIGGVDISEQQIAHALAHFGDVFRDPANPIWFERRDMTLPGAAEGIEEWADLVYCQSVLMHIHGGDRPRQFVRNMWKVSRRYVLLVENWRRHNVVAYLRELFPAAKPYLVQSGEVAGVLLDKRNELDYPVVRSDAQLRALVAPA